MSATPAAAATNAAAAATAATAADITCSPSLGPGRKQANYVGSSGAVGVGKENNSANATTMASSYSRPSFNYKDAEKKRPKNVKRKIPPLVLGVIQIALCFIILAANCCKIYASSPEKCPVEIVAIAFAYNFVQYEVDINDADMIREFIHFFRSLFVNYAPRYKKGRKTFINANFGEFFSQLDKNKIPKGIAFVTAFATEADIAREKDRSNDCVNHVYHGNHTIIYEIFVMIGNAMRCILDLFVTDKSIKETVDDHIALADIHIRCGTEGKGNDFPSFKKEVNKDQALKKFCEDFKDKLLPGDDDEDVTIPLGSYTYYYPIHIDMLLGIFNVVLYALYVYAMTGHALRVFFASTRSCAIFTSQASGRFTWRSLEIMAAGFGSHPNSAQRFIGEQSEEDVAAMDGGLSLTLAPLDGVQVNIWNNEDMVTTATATFEAGYSDAYQRIYDHRNGMGSGLEQRQSENISFEQLMKARRERHESKKVKRLVMKELKKKEKELRAMTRKFDRQVERNLRFDKRQSDFLVKKEATEKCKEQEYAEEESKRARVAAEAVDVLAGFFQ